MALGYFCLWIESLL